MTERFVFQAGDIVRCGEVTGELEERDGWLRFKHENLCKPPVMTCFNHDGSMRSHVELGCLLTLIERPKKKVKKRIEGWVNIYSESRYQDNNVSSKLMTKETADKIAGNDRLGEAHHIVHEWEEEE